MLRFARFGVIAYNTAAQHVPPAFKLENVGDVRRFSQNSANDFQHLHFSRLLNDMSGFLGLRQMEFVDVIDVLERCLKELSLPIRLLTMIKKQWNVPGLIKLARINPTRWLEKDRKFRRQAKLDPPPLPCPTIRALALILMALKYLFGLDDVSEYCQRSKNSFDILQWMRLSRQRAFLSCKYSPIFHKIFNQKLFDGDVHMSGGAWYEHTKARRVQLANSRNHQDFYGKDKFYAGTKELSQRLAQDLGIREFKEKFNTEMAKRKKVDTRRSPTPLMDFTLEHLKKEDGVPMEMTLNQRKALRELLKMQDKSLGVKFADDEAIRADVFPPMAVHDTKYFFRMIKEEKSLDATNIVFLNQKLNTSQRLQNHTPLYWTTRLKSSTGDDIHAASQWHSLSANLSLLSILPENFGWVLRYVSALFEVEPTEIYYELVSCERTLEKNHSQYLGHTVRSNEMDSSAIELENYLFVEGDK